MTDKTDSQAAAEIRKNRRLIIAAIAAIGAIWLGVKFNERRQEQGPELERLRKEEAEAQKAILDATCRSEPGRPECHG